MKKRVISLILVLLMAVGMMSAAYAFTANTGASATVQATLPAGLFLNEKLGNLSLVASTYYYDRGLGRNVQSYALSDASKLALLIDQCMPIYNMETVKDWLKNNNLVGSLDKYLDGQQKVTIWNSLTWDTQNRIRNGQMNALEALNYIKVSSSEYKSNSTLQKYVNYHLNVLLDGTELRAILKIVDPSNAATYDGYNATQLIVRAEALLATTRVANLISAMRTFRNVSTRPYDLERSYSAKQLASYYTTLSAAANSFYASYVTMLNNYRFTVTV